MPLLNDLIQTYDNVSGHEPDGFERLAPVAHHYASTSKVIDVKIDLYGNFADAAVNSKNDNKTLLAVTEESSSRTSAAATTPHALNDNLLFMLSHHNSQGEYGENKSYEAYMNQLSGWCESEFACDQIKAVYHYLSENDLADDLINRQKLPEGKDGKVDLSKYMKYVVRWIVDTENPQEADNTWENPKVIQSWTDYYSRYHERKKKKALVGISGKMTDIETLHPKIISAYGNSKLISFATKEDTTLHFKGERFNNPEQVLQIGYQDSQKIHNALGWLIDTQGIAISKNALPYEKTDKKPKFIVCWSPQYKNKTEANSQLAMLMGAKIKGSENNYRSYDDCLKQILFGLENTAIKEQTLSIFITDRSGDGRFSPVFYRSFKTQEYLLKLKDWYSNCIWYYWNSSLKRFTLNSPSLFNIAKCAYGVERINQKDIPYLDVNDSVFKDTINTLLAAVLDGRRIPESLVRQLAFQASAPERFSGNEGHRWWNWREILPTACALIHYLHMYKNPVKGVKDLKLDRENANRSYLFGRLLAVLDRIENVSLNQKSGRNDGEKINHRDTNAMRLWSAYTAHPYTCYANIIECVRPYLSAMKYGSRKFYMDEMQEIYTKLDLNDKKLNRPLDPEYLMGFYLERAELSTFKSNTEQETSNNN